MLKIDFKDIILKLCEGKWNVKVKKEAYNVY